MHCEVQGWQINNRNWLIFVSVILAMLVTNALQPKAGSVWIVGGGEMGRLIRALDWSQLNRAGFAGGSNS